MEIIAITTEVIIFGHNDLYIEVSGRTSAWSNFTLASELHSISSLNSGRNSHIDVTTYANATIACTFTAVPHSVGMLYFRR